MLIYLAGFAAFAVLVYAAYLSGIMSYALMGQIYALAALLVLLATYLYAYVYHLSYIRFDADGMTVVDYSALFTDRLSETLYRDIEDVQVVRPGILAAVFGWNTLMVETAGTIPNLKLTMVPNGSRWAAYLIHQARQARIPVSTS